MTILLAVGDCFAAFLLGPVLAELRARGVAFRVVAGAPEREVASLRAQLGNDATVHVVADEGAADRFASEVLTGSLACVAHLGAGVLTRRLTLLARQRNVRVVGLDGGVRAFGRPAGLALASTGCVAGELERLALAEHDVPAHEVAVVGDLVAKALAALPLPSQAPPKGLATLLEHATAADPLLLEMLERGGWPQRAALPEHAGVAAWIARAAAAEVVLTDSIAWQRVAVALGVPCVVTPAAGLWAPGVAAGLVTQMEPNLGAVLRVVARAARAGRGPGPVANESAARIVDVLQGVPKATAFPLPSEGDATGRTFGNDEAALVAMVLQRGTLNSTRGTMVTTFEKRFASWVGSQHAIACASGSAAVHCAIAALQLRPGDEVVTTPITDMGALTPILYEGGVPVFADVDPVTLNVTADTVRAQLTDRTRAIVVTHLFGNPCDLDGLQALANERGLVLIEDAAQAFGATWRGRKVGTVGRIGTFSLQQGKHITTGEGGIVVTDDADVARRVFLYVNKAWGYGDKKPDHYFPALNYRLTELQGAVALGQLPKLADVVAARRTVAATLQQALAGVEGLVLPRDPAHGTHSWWKFAFHVDRRLVPGGPRALATKLQAAGIACAPHYIQKPAFQCELFRDWRTSPVTWLPLQHNPRRERAAAMFDPAHYQGALGGLDSVVVLPINERYTQAHCDYVANAIRAAVGALRHG